MGLSYLRALRAPLPGTWYASTGVTRRRTVLGTNYGRRSLPLQVLFRAIVLGGTLGVSCTRNPLHAGPNSLPEGVSHSESTEHVALMVGSCAAGHREPGQVRKEAALSGTLRVPQGCLAGAGDSERTGGQTFEGRGTITLLQSRSVSSVLRVAVLLPAVGRSSVSPSQSQRPAYSHPMELDAGSCTLRTWTCDDVGPLASVANDHRISLNMTDTFPHPYLLEDAERWIDNCLEQGEPPLHMAIVVDRELVGGIGGHPGPAEQHASINIGYWLTPDMWGRGIATSALQRYVRYLFDTFDPHRLYATVFGWNPASARVLEKCGFRLEGRLREAIQKEGRFTDLLMYGLLRSDTVG